MAKTPSPEQVKIVLEVYVNPDKSPAAVLKDIEDLLRDYFNGKFEVLSAGFSRG